MCCRVLYPNACLLSVHVLPRITVITGLDGSYVADAGYPNNTLVLIAATVSLLFFNSE